MNEGTNPAGSAGGAGSEEPPKPIPTNARGSATGAPLGAGAAEPPEPPKPAPPRPSASVGMNSEQLRERLARERAAADKKWAEGLGFKTVDEAKAFVEEAKALKAKEDEKKLADLSEIDRLKAQLAAKDAEVAELRAQSEKFETDVLVERQNRIIGGIATEFVDPEVVDFATNRYKAHMKATMTDEQVEKLRDRDVRKFFADFVAKHPRYAKAAPPGEPPKAAPTPKRITTGAPAPKRDQAPRTPASPPGTEHGKRVNGKGKDRMNPDEVVEYAKKNGINYPSMGGVRR